MNPLFIYLIKSGAALVVFYVFFRMLMRGETFFLVNRYYLLGTLILSLVLPLHTFHLELSEPGRLYSFLLESVTIGETVMNASVAQKPGLFQLGVYFYFAVTIVLFLRFAAQISKLLWMIRKSGISTYRDVQVVFTEENIAPFSFFNLIFIPRQPETTNNLNEIIEHEKVHIRQLHSIDILFTEMLIVFQWFNPAVWQYRKSLKLTHEYLADAGVLKQGFNSLNYQHLLLTQSTGLQVSGLTNNFNHSLIKNRIIMMTKTKSGWVAKLKILIAVPVALLMAIALTIGMSETATAQLVKEQKPSEEKQIMETPKVLMDEDEFFTVVDEMPRYPGGDAARMKFLVENIKYPEAARKAGKQGNVFVQFIVEADGKITNANVLQGFDAECDAMALKTIQAMPDWIPGKHEGKNVRVQFVMPIRFSLGNESEEKKQE
jgi:TonB family protein